VLEAAGWQPRAVHRTQGPRNMWLDVDAERS
jgi:hypothetical protein